MEFLRRALDYALVGSFKRKVSSHMRQVLSNHAAHYQAAFVAGASFVVGFSMETFMVHTGFYKIVTQKEADRRQEAIVLPHHTEFQNTLMRLSTPRDNLFPTFKFFCLKFNFR
jgi:hypothetical protein